MEDGQDGTPLKRLLPITPKYNIFSIFLSFFSDLLQYNRFFCCTIKYIYTL